MSIKTGLAGWVALMGLMVGVSPAAEERVTPAESQPNQGGIVCINPNFNFGSIYSDVEVNHRYVLTNQGARVVKISAVRSTCGCTTAVASTNEMAPGQTAAVDVVLNFSGRRGRQNKSIYVETDDLQNRIVKLEFTGLVIVPIEAQPEAIHLGTIGVAGRIEREVLVNAVSTNTFHLLSVKSASPQVTVTSELRQEGKQYCLKVVFEGPRKLGSFMTSVEVETDHPQMKKLSIPLAGFVGGDIVAVPASLVFSPSATNVSKTVWVTLWSPGGTAFKITKVELPDEGMTHSMVVVNPDRYRMEIKTRGALAGADGKSIRIETDLPSMKELHVPIRVLTGHE